jgi:hypothetical protein
LHANGRKGRGVEEKERKKKRGRESEAAKTTSEARKRVKKVTTDREEPAES